MCFKFEFLDEDELVEALKIYDDDEDGLADDGSVIIHGLYLQGGSWDNKGKMLVEAKAKVITRHGINTCSRRYKY